MKKDAMNSAMDSMTNAGFAALARCTIVYTIESCPHSLIAHSGAKGLGTRLSGNAKPTLP
jgi:hypothetical protein